jgi:hypothetical protein
MKDEWIKKIKRNMVLLAGSDSNYRFAKNNQRSVLIDCGVAEIAESYNRKNRSIKAVPAQSQRNVLLDVSDANFLIVVRNPSIMRSRQLIPWTRIVDIVFKDELPLPELVSETA